MKKRSIEKNCEISSPPTSRKTAKSPDYYSFLYNDVRFIGICDAAVSEHVGHLSSESIRPFGQSQWLQSELEKPEQAKVIFGHSPLEPNAKDKNSWLSRNDSLFFNDLIERTKPTMMFFGHQHKPSKLKAAGRDMYIVRSSSWNVTDLPTGFLMISFQKEGVLVKEITFK